MDQRETEQLIEQAQAALRQGDDVRAVALADQILAVEADHPTVRAIRAQGLLGCGEAGEAFVEARRAVELNPEDETAQRVLALAAWRDERLTLAQESFCRAITLCGTLSGRKPPLLAEFAWFMATERGPRPAEEAARVAVEADDRSSTASHPSSAISRLCNSPVT